MVDVAGDVGRRAGAEVGGGGSGSKRWRRTRRGLISRIAAKDKYRKGNGSPGPALSFRHKNQHHLPRMFNPVVLIYQHCSLAAPYVLSDSQGAMFLPFDICCLALQQVIDARELRKDACAHVARC